MFPRLHSLLLVSACALTLVACAQVPRGGPLPEQQAAERLLLDGRYSEAALALQDAGDRAGGRARDGLWLSAAEAWLLAGEVAASQQALAKIDSRKLPADALPRYRLLHAGPMLESGQAEQALALLDADASAVPALMRPLWWRTRATALEATGQPLAAAAELARLEARQPDSERLSTRREIQRLLARLDDDALYRGSAALAIGDPLYRHAGSALTRRGLEPPRPFQPTDTVIAAGDRPPAAADGYRPPARLAVLLPLTGSMASAGVSVRDGILSAYYGENRARPTLRFYDTQSHPETVAERYRQALNDGAGQIIGPLGRDEVAALQALPELPVPVLALNRDGQPLPPGHAMFSLSPEDEAVAVAERLLRSGLTRVIAIGNGTESAERSLVAFGRHLSERGGRLLASVNIDPQASDFSGPLASAFAASGADGHDAVFMALRGPEARLLVPQLAVAGFEPRPMLATALVQIGTGNSRLDRELDGIEFPDLVWPMSAVPGTPSGALAQRALASARGGGARLFAFGMDAFRLSGYLEVLANDPGALLEGATGELRLDAFGNVVRQPAWAVFRGGRSRPLVDGGLLAEPVRDRPEQ